MARSLLRDKARVLRASGASLDEIASRLKAPKSTIRYWCRDIILSGAQQRRLFAKQKLGGIYAAEKIRKKRIQLTKVLLRAGMQEVGSLSKRELLLVGAALYWAEGYRKGEGEFGFTNSDPKMIRLIIRWLIRICDVKKKRVHLRVCINAEYKERVHVIQTFWSHVTGISQGQFSKPTIINVHNKKRYLNSKEYFGALRVKVRRSTNLKREILGWIAGLSKNSGPLHKEKEMR